MKGIIPKRWEVGPAHNYATDEWRVAVWPPNITPPEADLSPEQARELAALLIAAADNAERRNAARSDV